MGGERYWRAAVRFSRRSYQSGNQCGGQGHAGLCPQADASAADDRAIHDICAVTAYFNFVNRIADGLGVDLEEDERFPVTGIPAVD
jgi:hypothetical protein